MTLTRVPTRTDGGPARAPPLTEASFLQYAGLTRNRGRPRVAEDSKELLTATEAARYLQLRHTSRMRNIARCDRDGPAYRAPLGVHQGRARCYSATRQERLDHGWQRVRGVRVPAPRMRPDATSALLSAPEAAAILGVSVKRVYQLADDGRLGTRHGTGWRLPKPNSRRIAPPDDDRAGDHARHRRTRR